MVFLEDAPRLFDIEAVREFQLDLAVADGFGNSGKKKNIDSHSGIL